MNCQVIFQILSNAQKYLSLRTLCHFFATCKTFHQASSTFIIQAKVIFNAHVLQSQANRFANLQYSMNLFRSVSLNWPHCRKLNLHLNEIHNDQFTLQLPNHLHKLTIFHYIVSRNTRARITCENKQLQSVKLHLMDDHHQIYHVSWDDTFALQFDTITQVTLPYHLHEIDLQLPISQPLQFHAPLIKLVLKHYAGIITLPDTLEHLELHHYNVMINAWPSQLKTLILPHYNHSLQPLPDDLVVLELKQFNQNEYISLPSHLRKIHLSCYVGNVDMPLSFEHLHQLTYLNIHSYLAIKPIVLPDTIQILRYHTSNVLHHVPTSLHTMQVHAHVRIPNHVHSYYVAYLNNRVHAYLVHLHIAFCAISIEDYMFPHLKTLHVDRFIRNASIRSLPSTLTKLNIPTYDQYMDFDLPEHLLALDLFVLRGLHTWPARLQTLKIIHLDICIDIPWPETLIDLKIIYYDDIFHHPWPSSLRNLTLATFNRPLTHAWPDSLRTLIMNTFDQAMTFALPSRLLHYHLPKYLASHSFSSC